MTQIVNLKNRKWEDEVRRKLDPAELSRREELALRACAGLVLEDDEHIEYYTPLFRQVMLRMQLPEVFLTESTLSRMLLVDSLVEKGFLEGGLE